MTTINIPVSATMKKTEEDYIESLINKSIVSGKHSEMTQKDWNHISSTVEINYQKI